ncbi:MAG: hypothetical protein PHV82_04655 [Victivallaceae bacterium]|nr:hypothetical protein [Victivallaceae bacterium]
MKEIFSEMPSLPSLPSEIQDDPERLCSFFCKALTGAEQYPEATQRTLTLLMNWGNLILQHGHEISFSFSASELAEMVRRCDCLGPAQMGFYYEGRLRAECEFLVPRAIKEADILAFYRTLSTWSQNRSLFQCFVIGAVLAIKLLHLRKIMGGK